VKVQASDDSEIAHMEVYIDGRFLQTLSSAPFVFNITEIPQPGLHILSVIATDMRGRVSTDSISINFSRTSP
jgi:hypothetical protein